MRLNSQRRYAGISFDSLKYDLSSEVSDRAAFPSRMKEDTRDLSALLVFGISIRFRNQ